MLFLCYFLFLCFLDNVLYLHFPRLRANKLKIKVRIVCSFFLMLIIQPEVTSYFRLGLEFNTGEDSSASAPEIFVCGALA